MAIGNRVVMHVSVLSTKTTLVISSCLDYLSGVANPINSEHECGASVRYVNGSERDLRVPRCECNVARMSRSSDGFIRSSLLKKNKKK